MKSVHTSANVPAELKVIHSLVVVQAPREQVVPLIETAPVILHVRQQAIVLILATLYHVVLMLIVNPKNMPLGVDVIRDILKVAMENVCQCVKVSYVGLAHIASYQMMVLLVNVVLDLVETRFLEGNVLQINVQRVIPAQILKFVSTVDAKKDVKEWFVVSVLNATKIRTNAHAFPSSWEIQTYFVYRVSNLIIFL